MFVPVLLFALGLLLLIVGGNRFVDGATGIAYRFHIPELIVGATIVSIGTTLPEVMVSATSALQGHGEIAYGNAIGSIICNTALIAAITIAVRPGKAERSSLKIPVLFFFAAAVFYSFYAYHFGHFSRISGVILLTIFAVYMICTIRNSLPKRTEHLHTSPQTQTQAAADQTCAKQAPAGGVQARSLTVDLLSLAVGAVMIAIGADLLVDNGTLIAQAIGVPESVIALTFVALGTSLPELVTAITSLIKGHSSLSLGNIIGANLFNLVFVSGISITLAPFDIPQSSVIAGHNASLVLDIPLMFFVMLVLTVPVFIRNRLSRIQGIVLLAVYGAYCMFQFTM
ncbi:calcium/sodium antiporter [Parablautia sp. Marseille-Q6255]|uniref:calcium/sodium antiporter n=1 Tax=Parablautia sp. Marseille-Q6255 TaxID=3039593 RepID=UPI0024BCEA98|nr:calcium/sodium antiporter [Parablautia sp. Marseille-Q6255]